MESLANITGGIGMLLFPNSVLYWMTKTSTPITPLHLELVQWLGGVVLALTTPLLLAYPNTIAGIINRSTCYWTLGAGEAALVPIMAWQLMSGQSSFSDNSLIGGIAVLGGTLAYRAFVLNMKPEWVGIVKGAEKSA